MIAQLVAHAAGKSILCLRGGDAAFPKLFWDFLLLLPQNYNRDIDSQFSFLSSVGSETSTRQSMMMMLCGWTVKTDNAHSSCK